MQSQRALAKERAAAEQVVLSTQLRLANCRLTDWDWEQLSAIYSDDKWTALEQMRVKACTPPQATGTAAQQALEEVEVIEVER